jgi:phage replication-related protein YjqB (UPF0714/DUF867 family)
VQCYVYLTEPEQNEESAERPLVSGVDEAAAQQLCRALNEGGYLRPGLVARSVDDRLPPLNPHPITAEMLRDAWATDPGLTEEDKAALAALSEEELAAAIAEAFEDSTYSRMWFDILDECRGEVTRALLNKLGREPSEA